MAPEIGLNEQHVKGIFEKHLEPHFNGTKVQLVIPDSETYEKIIKELV
jgi:hypothetical protein